MMTRAQQKRNQNKRMNIAFILLIVNIYKLGVALVAYYY